MRVHYSPWVLVLFVSGTQETYAQNANPNPNNLQFDPEVTETGWCNLPPFQDDEDYPTPQPGMCMETSSSSPLTLEDARLQAVDYAPYLYFHPLEQYTLTDVKLMFENPKAGKVYYGGKAQVFDEQLNQTSMLRSTRDPVLGLESNKYFISHMHSLDGNNGTELYTHDFLARNPPGYLGGSGYDANNHTKAPIYYNVYDSGNNTWTFVYWFYYAFNGHSKLGVLSSWNGTETYTPFQLSPMGQHEGDWEAMMVQVCQSTSVSQPLAVKYNQHGWNQITDCSQGECNFYKDTFHPVGFAALNSHATYPIPTTNMVYATVELPFFVNLQGVVIVDRTEFRDSDGYFKQFLPNANNVIPLKDPKDIQLEVTPQSEYWQAWGGKFGDDTKPTMPLQEYCLSMDQQSYVDCPTIEEDPIFTLVMQFLGVYQVNQTEHDHLILQAAGAVSGAVKGFFMDTGHGPPGPQTKHENYLWLPPENAPIWNMIDKDTNEGQYCQRLIYIPDTTITSVDSSDLGIMKHVIWIVVISIILPMVGGVWYLWPRIRGTQFQPVVAFEDGEIKKPNRTIWWKVHRPALAFTISFLFAIAGLVIFGNGYANLFDLLDQLIGGDLWEFVTKLLMALGIIVAVLDTCLLISIWLPTIALWRHVWIVYYEAIGDVENADDEKMSWFAKHFTAKHVMHAVFFSLLFLSLCITAVCVIVGIGVVGFSGGFREICNKTIGSMNGICLDLSMVGIEEVACGAEFQEFCQNWGSAARVTTLWGAFLMLWAHFFFIATAGEAYASQISIYPQLLALKEGQGLHKPLVSAGNQFRDDTIAQQTKTEGVTEVGEERPVSPTFAMN